jgi:precorrin-2 dehydrogenase/sirohydrochlorin ferrochelatase
MNRYYPAFLDLSGKRCVVVGGGQVALRKVEMILDFGGSVEAISPVVVDELRTLSEEGSIALMERSYEKGDVQGAFLVIAATDDVVTNQDIANDARSRGILVNVVDTPGLCDFIVPSYFKRGSVTVAVSTSGTSPALAKKVRSDLQKAIGEEYAILSEITGEVRSRLKRESLHLDSDVWSRALENKAVMDYIRSGDRDKAKHLFAQLLMGNREAFDNAT